MNKLITAALLAVLTTLNAASSFSQEKHIVVLIDGSPSYNLVVDPVYANRIANDTIARIPQLHLRDKITVAPIGDYSSGNHIREVQLTKRLPPERAVKALKELIVSFPNVIKKTGTPKSTNIIGALGKMARRVNCAQSKAEGHIYVLSDGIETGVAAALPATPIFQGCGSFTVIGVLGTTPAQTTQLGKFWMGWCKAAGFRRCDWLS